jgi:hypothetical protein
MLGNLVAEMASPRRAEQAILSPGKPVAFRRLLVRSGQHLTDAASGPLGLSTWAVAGASS